MYSEYDATADSSVVNCIRLLIRPKILLIRKSKCFVCFCVSDIITSRFCVTSFFAAFDHKILATILICFIFMRLLPSCTGGKYCDKPVCKLCLSVCLSVCLRGHLKKQLSKLNYVGVARSFFTSFFPRRRCDMLCTSGFVDDTAFAHNM